MPDVREPIKPGSLNSDFLLVSSMLRDLLDSLRCPRDHEESWLVAVVQRANGPVLVDADLACPVCGAEFALREGLATFAESWSTEMPAPGSAETLDPARLTALLGVTEGAYPLLLSGNLARAGAGVAELIDVPQLWINAPDDISDAPTFCSRLVVGDRLPLGVATVAAAALDARHASPMFIASAVRTVRQGGRIVAPVATPVPAGVRELARDDAQWVGEVIALASGLIELRRRAPDHVG